MSSNENHTDCVMAGETYIQPDSPMFIVGTSCMPLGCVLVILTGIFIVKNENRPVMKASDPGYLYMVLLSLLIGYFTGFIPLLKPSHETCSAEYYFLVTFASLITTNLLYKCLKVYDIFAAAKNFAAPKLGLLLKRTGQTVFNVLTLAIAIAVLLVDRFTGGGPSWGFEKQQQVSHSTVYLVCTSANNATLILPMLVPGLSFFLTLILAFKMRQFPHNFRESLNIFCATFVVLLWAMMFLTGYSFSPPEVRPVLRAIVLFITCTAFFCCIYIPKILIMLKTNRNIEEEREQIRAQVKKYAGANELVE